MEVGGTHQNWRSLKFEYVPLGILLGPNRLQPLWGRAAPSLRPGVATYELWLKLGIVLVGRAS